MELDVSEGNKKEPTASPHTSVTHRTATASEGHSRRGNASYSCGWSGKRFTCAHQYLEKEKKKQLMQFSSYPVGSTPTYSPCGWRSRWAPAINLGRTSCEEDIYYMAKRREKRRGRDGDACSSSSCTQSNRLSGGDRRGGRVRVTSCNRSR